MTTTTPISRTEDIDLDTMAALFADVQAFAEAFWNESDACRYSHEELRELLEEMNAMAKSLRIAVNTYLGIRGIRFDTMDSAGYVFTDGRIVGRTITWGFRDGSAIELTLPTPHVRIVTGIVARNFKAEFPGGFSPTVSIESAGYLD